MSEKQTGICQRFRTALENSRSPTLSRVLSIKRKYPDFFFFYHLSSCFVSFYIIFRLAVLFHVNSRFQKEKNFEEALCLQQRRFISVSLHLH